MRRLLVFCLVFSLVYVAGPARSLTYLPYIQGTLIPGNCAQVGSDGLSIIDSGLPCQGVNPTDQTTLTSNNYTVVQADCFHIKVLPTGTTPTITLPNLNTSCVVQFMSNAAVAYTVNATGSGSTQNSSSFHVSKAAAGANFWAVVTTPSGTAAVWTIGGDLAS